jgi:hypothetical protein
MEVLVLFGVVVSALFIVTTALARRSSRRSKGLAIQAVALTAIGYASVVAMRIHRANRFWDHANALRAANPTMSLAELTPGFSFRGFDGLFLLMQAFGMFVLAASVALNPPKSQTDLKRQRHDHYALVALGGVGVGICIVSFVKALRPL